MKALHSLEEQACDENTMMRQLAEKSSRDSTSVRILTIITLIYLPCTVVSVSTLAVRCCASYLSLDRAFTPHNLWTRQNGPVVGIASSTWKTHGFSSLSPYP